MSVIRGELFFFKASYAWRIREGRLQAGYPALASRHWRGIPGNVGAAYEDKRGNIWFFKGGWVQHQWLTVVICGWRTGSDRPGYVHIYGTGWCGTSPWPISEASCFVPLMQGMIKHEHAENMLLTTDKYMCCAVPKQYCTLIGGYCISDGTCEFYRIKCIISRLTIWVKIYSMHLEQE